jgi:hypothetical protein
MCYIKGTLDFCLTYSKSTSLPHPFIVYTDANHGGCVDSGKSTSSYLVMISGCPVSWRSKLQTIVLLSTSEAEYVAGVEAGKELKWVRHLLSELRFPAPGPSPLLMDKSAIAVSKNPEHHGRMKHLNLAYY